MRNPLRRLLLQYEHLLCLKLNKYISLDAVNQAKPDILHWINIPTMYPLPDAQITYIVLFTGVSWKRKKMLKDKIQMNLTLTCFHRYPLPPDDISRIFEMRH